VFTSSTTDSINKVVSALDRTNIPTIITTDIEHNSNFLPQFQAGENGIGELKIFPHSILDDGGKLE